MDGFQNGLQNGFHQDMEAAYIKEWKKIFKGFLRVKAYVVFSHGSVVLFHASHEIGDLQTTKIKACNVLCDFKSKFQTYSHDYATLKLEKWAIACWNGQILSLLKSSELSGGIEQEKITLDMQDLEIIHVELK